MKNAKVLFLLLAMFCWFAVEGRGALAYDQDGQPQLDQEKLRRIRDLDDKTEQDRFKWEQKRIEAQIEMVKARRKQVNDWLGQIDLADRHVIDKPKVMPKLMAEWETQNKVHLYRILEHADKSHGSIESGADLNFLIGKLGATALQNVEMRRIKPDAALPLTAPSDMIKVDRDLADEIALQDDISGAKTVWQGNRGPLDLDWPAILRDDPWKSYRDRFGEARKKALDEITSSAVVSNDTDRELRQVVADLNTSFAEYRRDWVCHEHPDVDRALEYHRICEGSCHIQKLVLGAYQFANLTPTQVKYREKFEGGSIEEYIAYFRRNNLRVAAAAPRNLAAYHKIFNMMVRYYLDAQLAMNLEREIDDELATLKDNRQEAVDAALGRIRTVSGRIVIGDLLPTRIVRLSP